MTSFRFFSSVRHSSVSEELPNEFEQETVRAYVCERKLCRPDSTIGKGILKIIVVVSIAFFFTFLTFYFLTSSDSFPAGLKNELTENYLYYFFLFFLTLLLIVFFAFLKKLLIEIIRIYQHYAPEDIRRRCLFMPTCSEYTILALEKYGVLLGLHKAYIRIFKKCRGNIYRVDNP